MKKPKRSRISRSLGRTEAREAERLVGEYERGELTSSVRGPAELKRYERAARATLAKDRRLNIRISSPVLEGLQARAAEEGLPYQTLIASVLHKFVTGRLVERR
jgi:predicted DNA binding CopG/RHH family protein